MSRSLPTDLRSLILSHLPLTRLEVLIPRLNLSTVNAICLSRYSNSKLDPNLYDTPLLSFLRIALLSDDVSKLSYLIPMCIIAFSWL